MAPLTKGLSEGDIVLVDFEAWTDEGNLFDTTRPKVAEEAGWDPDVPLRPMPVLIGGGRVVPGFEQAIQEAEPGEEKEVEVPAEKAFGPHDPNKVRVFPRKEFEKADIDPVPGNQVEINNQRGVITQATASRIRVDFNHPMAGRTLTYKFKVEEVIEGDRDRLEALLAIDYSVTKTGDFEVEIEDGVGRIHVPHEALFDHRWIMAKHRLGHDVFEHTDLDQVELVETLEREEFDAHDHGHGHEAPVEEAEDADGSDEDEA